MNARTRPVVLAAVAALAAPLAATRAQKAASCAATSSSLTPATWSRPGGAPPAPVRAPLRLIGDVALPGPANRFDYQSVDPVARRLYISHMSAGTLVVFDLDANRVVGSVPGVGGATGVWAVPAHHAIYVSASARHEVAVVDDRTLQVVARVGGVRFPDGIAYAPAEDLVFVSDEAGGKDIVIDARWRAGRAVIPLGGEAGNTHYDSVSHCVLVAVQTRNELAAIDPATRRVVARYALPGADHPHGFALDEMGRLAFVTNEGSATLQLVDLRTMHVLSTTDVGDDPDVVAWDDGWQRLYVASEGGVVSVFALVGSKLERIQDYRAPRAHSVAVDPMTHRVYLPLQDVGGRPVLRILEPEGRE